MLPLQPAKIPAPFQQGMRARSSSKWPPKGGPVLQSQGTVALLLWSRRQRSLAPITKCPAKEISPIKSNQHKRNLSNQKPNQLAENNKTCSRKKYQSLLVFQKNQNLKNKTLTHPLLHKLQSSSSLYNKEYLQNSPLTITYYKLIQF